MKSWEGIAIENLILKIKFILNIISYISLYELLKSKNNFINHEIKSLTLKILFLLLIILRLTNKK